MTRDASGTKIWSPVFWRTHAIPGRKDKLIVRGTEINVQWDLKRDDFLSLTDIAKIKDNDNPRYIIQNWLRNRNTIEFLGVGNTLQSRF